MNRIRKRILLILVGAFAVTTCFWAFTLPPVKLYEVNINLAQKGAQEDRQAIEKKLNSTTLLRRIVYRLGLNAPIYASGKNHDSSLFNSSPIKITTDTLWGFETGTPGKFRLNNDKILMGNSTYKTGEWVHTPYGKLLFSRKASIAEQHNADYYFSLIPIDAATQKLRARMNITALNGSSANLKLAVRDENPATAEAILMALIYNYNYNYNPAFHNAYHAVQPPTKILRDSIALVENSLLSLEKKKQTPQLQKEKQTLMDIYSQLLQQREHRSLMAIVPHTSVSRTPGKLIIAGKPVISGLPVANTLGYLEILMATFIAGIIIVLLPGTKAWLPVSKPAVVISRATTAEESFVEPLPELSANPSLIPVSSNPPVKKKRVSEPSGLLEDIASIPLNPSARTIGKTQFPSLTPKSEKPIVTSADKEITIREQFGVISKKLDQLCKQGFKKIAVTSLISGQGKSFIAGNLALSLALEQKKTLLIDMDLYLASITRRLTPRPQAGVSDYLEGKANLNSIVHRTGISKELSFINAGKRVANPTAIIENGHVDLMLELLAERFDNIIVDLPPIDLATDAYKVAPFCDALIVAIAGIEEQREIETKLNFPDTAKTMFINTLSVVKKADFSKQA
jgi:capsular exopolysaccharide synthesis family protein